MLRRACLPMQTTTQLPIPPHFEAQKVGKVWRVPYQERAQQARDWANIHHIKPAFEDKKRTCLLSAIPNSNFDNGYSLP